MSTEPTSGFLRPEPALHSGDRPVFQTRAGAEPSLPFGSGYAFWLKKFISFWLMPLQVGLLLVVAGIWLIRRGRRPRLGRALVFAGVGLVLVLSQSLVSKALLRGLQDLHPPVAEFTPGQPVPEAVARVRFIAVLGGGNGFSPGVAATNLLSSSAISRLTEGYGSPAPSRRRGS